MDPDDLRVFVANARAQQPTLDADITSRVLGEREKRCIAVEEPARRNARRSIVAVRDIAAGETIHADMVTFKRPGTGLSPKELHSVVGARARAAIEADTIITRDLLE
jgi:N-acetylneuraminate synthase